MKKIILTAALSSIALSGCGTYPISTFQPYQTKDLNSLVDSGLLKQKTDTFYIINDSSSSMSHTYWGEGFPGQSEPTKFSVGRELLIRMNKAIPDITLSSGIRSFGYGPCVSWKFTKLNQPIQSYSSPSFLNALDTLECSSGGTPIDRAFNAANTDLASASGNIALILVSDGHNYDVSPTPAVQALKDKYGDRLCISTIWVGNEDEEDGQAVLQQLSDISGCGFSTTANELAKTNGMATFVQDVFFNAATPVPVAETDGDGIPDDEDDCPDTPLGVITDKNGCWTLRGVLFDFDKYAIKPEYTQQFENSISILNRYPTMKVELQGHTDSIGTKEYNQNLSERRATSVEQYLINHGINSTRLTTKGFGESEPIESNNSKEGRAHNRRVHFKVIER